MQKKKRARIYLFQQKNDAEEKHKSWVGCYLWGVWELSFFCQWLCNRSEAENWAINKRW